MAVLSVDAIDMSGKHEVDLDTNIWKVCVCFNLACDILMALHCFAILVTTSVYNSVTAAVVLFFNIFF